MIKLKILNGPHVGKEYEILSMVAPGRFLHGIYLNEWLWEIDYSKAITKEKEEWMRHDIALRCIRALKNGRVVKFYGKTYRLELKDDKAELKKVCQELEDGMVNSGRMISIDSDNNQGVVIGVGGFEKIK
jgi:hypothetical protein